MNNFNKMLKNLLWINALFFAFNATAQIKTTAVTDELSLGNIMSEQLHKLTSDNAQIINGGLGETARILLPPPQPSWTGGKITFKLRVDPKNQNYITIRLWGNDVTDNRLLLLCDGKQVGYRHIGDIDMLDVGSVAPFVNDRFFYTTLPLPVEMTKGKAIMSFEIHSNGPIWAYGDKWDQYQKKMTLPTRGIYRVYIHTDPTFVPSVTEAQGKIPSQTIREAPGAEVVNLIKARVNNEINHELSQNKPLSQVQMQLLAKAYHVKWCDGYQNDKLVLKVINSLDATYLAYLKTPRIAESDPATPNAEWFGLGICGQVLYLLKEPMQSLLDIKLPGTADGIISRRDAFATMLEACRNWHQWHRRMYSNQSMINDLYGIYYANKGLQNIKPQKALPEEEMLRYFFESLGMQPWLGSETAMGPSRSAGDQYFQLTKKGLTKELGYVGNYGEVLDWVSEMYEATRPDPSKPGNEKIKKRIEEIALARAYFRFPSFDNEGYKAMRMETVVGWRDNHYPGGITYAQRDSWDGTPLQIAAVTMSPKLIGFAKQMIDDNQLYHIMAEHIKTSDFRTTAGLLPMPDQLDVINVQPKTPYELPMTETQPDFAFTDEEDGVVAVKNGDEMLYVSLYWRARNAVNFLARIHFINPVYQNIATIYQDELFEPSGNFYTRKDWTNTGYGNGGIKYPESIHSANEGEKLLIAKIPADVPYKMGDENPYAGRASFYRLKYGKYLIGMNNSDKVYKMDIPAEFSGATNLITHQLITNSNYIPVNAGTTVILYKK